MPVAEDYKKLYKLLIDAASHRQQYSLATAYRNLEYYRGNQWQSKPGPESGIHPLTINWVGSGIFRKFGNITYKIPDFSATPMYNRPSPITGVLGELAVNAVPPDGELRQIIASAVRELFEQSGAWDACRAALLDQFILGWGVVYVGWDDSLGPYAARVSPFDFYYDPQRAWHDWYRGAFAGRAFRMYLEDLKKTGWSNVDKIKPVSGGVFSWEVTPPTRPKPIADEVTVLEGWFRDVRVGRTRGNHRIIWAYGFEEKPLLVEEWPYTLESRESREAFPFYVMFNHVIPEHFAALSDIDVTKDVQDELNQLRSYSRARALLALKLYTRRGILDKEELERLCSPIVGEVVQGNADAASDPIRFLPAPPYNMDLVQAGGDVMRDIAALQGIDDAMRGIQSPRRQTATEAQLIASRSASLVGYIQRTFEKLISDVAEGLWQLMVQFEHTGLETRTPNGAVAIDMRHLIPARIEVSSGSTRAEEKEWQLAALAQFITFVSQSGLLAGPANPAGIISAEWLAKALAERLDIRLPEEAFAQRQMTTAPVPLAPGAVPAQPVPEELPEETGPVPEMTPEEMGMEV